jgi:hypothetical protein
MASPGDAPGLAMIMEHRPALSRIMRQAQRKRGHVWHTDSVTGHMIIGWRVGS